MGGQRDANDRVVWLLPGMTFDEALRHIAGVNEDVTYSVDVRPQEARTCSPGSRRPTVSESGAGMRGGDDCQVRGSPRPVA